MSAPHDVDRLLATWFAGDAAEAAPRGLVEAIAQASATTRRQPSWLPVGRRLPALPHLPKVVRVVALAAILLVAAIASLMVAGSRPRVPPPFGPARPGLFAMSFDGNIVMTSQDGVVTHALTSGDAVNTNPTFSRDGTQLAFWSWATTSNLAELVVMGADGSGRRTIASVAFTEQTFDIKEVQNDPTVRQLIYAILYDRHPSFDWSPDGRFIAYTQSDVNTSQVYVASTDGSGSTPIGDPAIKGASPAWSPDGSLIAFAAGATDSERGLYLMRPDGTPVRRLTRAGEGYAGGFAATWSPDGSRLAFTGGGGGSSMWLVDVDGSNEQRVDDGDHLSAPAWAPDGKRLAWLHPVLDLSQPAEYRVADAKATHVQVIPQPAAPRVELAWDTGAPYVSWSADGKYVIGVLASDGSTIDRLIEFDPDKGETHIITAPGLRGLSQQRLAP